MGTHPVALIAWALAMTWYGWAVWLSPAAELPAGARPAPRAWLIYLASVAAMIAGIQVGRLLLDRADRLELLPAVIVICVGLHLVPFATAFGAHVFRLLGWAMAAIGSVGLMLGWFSGGVAVAAAAVVTGLVMLTVMGWGTRSSAESSVASYSDR